MTHHPTGYKDTSFMWDSRARRAPKETDALREPREREEPTKCKSLSNFSSIPLLQLELLHIHPLDDDYNNNNDNDTL